MTILILLLPSLVMANPYPIHVVKGLLVSEAVIDGHKVLVIFDTGAPGLVLNKKYYQPEATPPVRCSGINGSFDCQTYKVKEWSWMGTQHKKTKALVSDLSFLEKALRREVHALIGLSVLKEYYVSIDFDRQTISMSEKMNHDKKDEIRFQYVDHLPVITCQVNGEDKLLGLDTGSEVNYLFAGLADVDADMLVNASPIIVIGTENKEELKHILQMGVCIADQPVLESEFIINLQDNPISGIDYFDGLLGQAFLSKFNLTIHPTKQIMLLSPRQIPESDDSRLTAQL